MFSYKDFINENNKLMSASDIIKYITRITPDESDIPDYFFDLIKKSGKKFIEKRVKISDLLRDDPSLKEYVEGGEERYEDSDYEPQYFEIDYPIVVFNNEVIDGYNRTGVKYRMGEDYIDAYVSI